MIKLTRLNNSTFVLNSDLIETISANPDTVIFTMNGNSYVVKESINEIIEQVIEFKSKIFINQISNQ
jgi:flagellar protein FlbD